MAVNFNGSSSLSTSSGVVSGSPCTIVAWAKPRILHNGYLAALGNASDSSRQALYFRDDGIVRAVHRNGSTIGDASSTSTYSANTWVHATAVFSSLSSRAVFVDGSDKQTSSVALGSVSLTDTHIGSRPPGAFYFDGDLAEVAIWSAALSDREVRLLAEGFSPLSLVHRIGELVLYRDLIRSTDRPHIGPATTAAGGGLSASPHPRINYSSRVQSAGTLTPLRLYGQIDQAMVATPGADVADTFAPGAEAGLTYPFAEAIS